MSNVPKRRAFLGLLFILIGSVLLLQWANLFTFFSLPGYLFSWKMILIILGLFLMATNKNWSTGVILFLIGAVFLSMDIFSLKFWQVMRFAIPGLFLLAGVVLLFPRRSRLRRKSYRRMTEEDIKDFIEDVNIFSGGSKAITSDNFRGGEVTCIFGGAELNFRNAKLAEGANVLDITCIFGGVTLYVPDDWTVRLDITPVFGGFSDGRAESNMKLSTDPNKLLVIKGTVIFGGGEVKIV